MFYYKTIAQRVKNVHIISSMACHKLYITMCKVPLGLPIFISLLFRYLRKSQISSVLKDSPAIFKKEVNFFKPALQACKAVH